MQRYLPAGRIPNLRTEPAVKDGVEEVLVHFWALDYHMAKEGTMGSIVDSDIA